MPGTPSPQPMAPQEGWAYGSIGIGPNEFPVTAGRNYHTLVAFNNMNVI